MARNTQTETANTPVDRLKAEVRDLVGALGDRAVATVQDKVGDATNRLTGYVDGGAGPGFMAAVTGAKDLAEGKGPVRSMLGAGLKGVSEKVRGMFGKGGGGKGKKLKVTNIVESIDVGVPITLAYNQWSQFSDFPGFMKKVENVEQQDDETKAHWKAQVFWSHREWESTIIEQRPDDKIIWRSTGAKGHVDGAVTFHELAPNLTRILVVLEYHPQGMFERTGNIWRAQGRRARLELKHFRRHVMSEAILHPDEIEGWRGVIEDGEVVQDHESALDEEERNGEEADDRSQADAAGDREQDGEEYEDFADDQDAYAEDEAGPEDEAEPEDGDIEPDGEANGDRPARRTRAARAPARSGRNGGTTRRSGRSTRTAERPRRTARSGATRRGEDS